RAAGDDPDMAGCAAGAKISCETVLALTALTPAQAGPEFLLARNRSHWGIENGLHLRRDTTYAEDASRLRAGDAPRLFASIASTVVSVLNRAGLTNHAAARPPSPPPPPPAATSAGTVPACELSASSACNPGKTSNRDMQQKPRPPTLTQALPPGGVSPAARSPTHAPIVTPRTSCHASSKLQWQKTQVEHR